MGLHVCGVGRADGGTKRGLGRLKYGRGYLYKI